MTSSRVTATVLTGAASLLMAAAVCGTSHADAATPSRDTRATACTSATVVSSRPVAAAATMVTLTVPQTTFAAGSWGNGIIYEACGFAALSPVTLMLTTVTGPGTKTDQQHIVDSEPDGSLASVWTPPTAPQAPGANGYPRYLAWAYQNGTPTTPAVVTYTVPLSVGT